MDRKIIEQKLETLIKGFMPVLYQEDDPDYNSGKLGKGVENRERYKYWEWTQGVGLFGLWKLFEKTRIFVAYFPHFLRIQSFRRAAICTSP